MRVEFSSGWGGDVFDTSSFEDYTLVVATPSNTQTQRFQISPQMALAQFKSLVQQVASTSLPYKVTIIRHGEIWSQLKQEWRNVDYSAEFMNSAYSNIC